MIAELAGNYFVRLLFGTDEVDVNLSSIKMFSIIQDMDRFLPSIQLRFADTMGTITHMIPFDNKMKKIRVELGFSSKEVVSNGFDFCVYRRKPESNFSSAVDYEIVGLLDVDNLFIPRKTRSFSDQIKNTLETIATDELACTKTDIGASLNYSKTLIQANWSNSTFLSDLKSRLIGRAGEYAYKIFIKMIDKERYLVCKSIKEFYESDIKYRFYIGDKIYKDGKSANVIYPIYDYSIIDNSVLCNRKQAYTYFDYTTSTQVSSEEEYGDFFSLTERFLIDGNDCEASHKFSDYGRNNEFTSTFEENTKAKYFDRLSKLSNMWILSVGLPNISPGDIVQIIFNQGITSGNLLSYQYSGYWMVRRAVHIIGETFKTRLLLSRNGVDTDQDTTLCEAVSNKR